MKKILTAALAATLALSSLGVASAAEAQSRGNYEQRQDRRDDRNDDRGDRWDDRRDNRDDRREWRQDSRDDRREFRQDQRAYSRWQQSQRRYNAGRYYAPRGYQQRDWWKRGGSGGQCLGGCHSQRTDHCQNHHTVWQPVWQHQLQWCQQRDHHSCAGH